jgi:NitT/TauT family transport system ATP-binding protein
MTQQDMLRVNIESKVFDAAQGAVMPAVRGLEFCLKENSFSCIIGPSGCGKTTTLRILLGLDETYSGTIDFDSSKSMTAVFQEPRLLPWRTVEQNVRLALSQEGNSLSLDALFEELGLADVRQFYPGELSLGMARRAALARAFAVLPDLLILDEPFVSLDDANAQRLRSLLLSLWQSKSCTALMVTHNVLEAAMLADKIIVLSARPATKIAEIDLDVAQADRDSAYIQEISHKVRQAGLVEPASE